MLENVVKLSESESEETRPVGRSGSSRRPFKAEVVGSRPYGLLKLKKKIGNKMNKVINMHQIQQTSSNDYEWD